MEDKPLTLNDEVGALYGGPFVRAGYRTSIDLIAAIKRFGLREVDGGQYELAHPLAPRLYQVGSRKWEVVLSHLERLGFNWREHVVGSYNILTDPAEPQLRAEIVDALYRLADLVCAYKTRYGRMDTVPE